MNGRLNKCITDFLTQTLYLLRGVYCLTVSGDVAVLNVGEPAKPLINAGLGNGVTC